MQIGIKIGKHFIGYRSPEKGTEVVTKGQLTIGQPDTEKVEAGLPYTVSFTNVNDALAALTGRRTDSNLIELFGAVSEIYAPVVTLASMVANGRYGFFYTKTGEPVIGNMYLDKFLNTPNPLQNINELFYEAVCYFLVTGKNFMYSSTPDSLPRVDYKNIMATYNLPSDQVYIDVPKMVKLFTAVTMADIVKGYVLSKGTSEEQTFKTENVLYRRSISLDWNGKKLIGRSPLLSADKAIANLIAVYAARNAIYVKRGPLGAIVSRKSDMTGQVALTPPEKEEVTKAFMSTHGVQKGQTPLAITEQPVDFIKFGATIQELEPFAETKADASAIYAALEVPDELMPGNDNGTYENKKTAERGLYRNKAIPMGESLCKSLTTQLNLHIAGIEMRVSYEHVEVLQEDKKFAATVEDLNAKTYKALFLNGQITLNDWRNKRGMDAAKNKIYDKLVFDMDDQELALVNNIMQLQMKLNPTVENITAAQSQTEQQPQ